MPNPAMHHVNINVNIPKALWRTFRIECIMRDLSASAVLTDAIQQQLQQWQREEHDEKRAHQDDALSS